MENLKNELNAQENAPISDEKLSAVSGGVYISADTFYSTIVPAAYPKVRVIDGSSCPKCGCTVGEVVVGVVKCEKCGETILENCDSKAIVFL